MSLFSKLFSKGELVEAGVCPNCWGEQEYDGIALKKIEEKQITINNHEARHAFIQEFVVQHVVGIHLHKEDDKLVCQHGNHIH